MKTVRLSVFVLAWAIVFLGRGGAAELAGVTFPKTLSAGNTELKLNGAGIGDRFHVDLFVGGLYLENPSSHAPTITQADEAMAIRLHILSPLVTSRAMINGTRRSFEKSMEGRTEPIQEEIEQFLGAFRPEISIGEVFDLVYLPGVGVEVRRNGKVAALSRGSAFKQALFEVWLGRDSPYPSLRQEMLGGTAAGK